MDDKPPPSLERCAAHNLAVGPDGSCVICRRERAGERAGEDAGPAPARSAGPRWRAYAAAASLGIAFLGGYAIARRPAAAPRAEPGPESAVAVDPAPPVEARPTATLDEPATPAPPPPPAAAPSASSSAPPRNYLDEAYAALDKRHLYDNPRPPAAPAPSASTGAPAPRRVYVGRGRRIGPSLPAVRTGSQ